MWYLCFRDHTVEDGCREPLGDFLLCSILVTCCLYPYGRGGRRQVLICGKCVHRWEINCLSVRWVIRDTASAILLSSPRMRPTEAWMCWCLAAKDISHRIGSTGDAVLILPLLVHHGSAVLSTYVFMFVKVDILGAKIRSCMSSAPSLRSFIVTSPVGLEEDTRRA